MLNEPPGMRPPPPSHWAKLVTARRQRLTHIRKFVILGVAAVIFCAAIGVAVAVLVRPPTIEGQFLVPGSPAPRSGVNPSLLPSVEQVAAKALPSVVTLQANAGGATEVGSGIVLTSDGLIMTNNHVVTPIDAAPPESASTVVTLYDGRSATFSVVATDPTSDIAVVRAQRIAGRSAGCRTVEGARCPNDPGVR